MKNWVFLLQRDKSELASWRLLGANLSACLHWSLTGAGWVAGSWVRAGKGMRGGEDGNKKVTPAKFTSPTHTCTHVHTPRRGCAAALMRDPQELLGRLLKERRDVEAGQAGVWGAGGGAGGAEVCLCGGERQPFVFVGAAAVGR